MLGEKPAGDGGGGAICRAAAAIAANGGVRFKTVGDAPQAAFSKCLFRH